MTRPDGLAVTHAYDTPGRLVATTLPPGQGALTRTDSPTTGALSSIQGPDASTLLQYSYDDPLLTETRRDPGGYLVHRAYDDHLRLACECLDGTCDLVGGVCTGGTYPITLRYDLDGMLIQAGELSIARDAGNGLITGEVLLAVDYARDALGRIVQRTETFGASAGGGTRVFEYAYDLAGRLQAVSEDGVHVAQYTYDANGNRLSKSNPSLPGSDVAGEYDAQDRLLSYGDATYDYTANGELAQKEVAGDVTTYSYDALGNLRAVVLPDGREITYTVDGENHRIWKTVDGVRVQGFLWRSALQVVAELDGVGNVVSRFVYGDQAANVPDYMVRAGGTYRILKDHLGSPRLVVDSASGLVVQRMDYDEFGRVLADTNPGWQPFGFAGGLWDADAGLVRFGARDYDAETGRWTSKDPIRFGGGLNLFGYCQSDPVNYIDISGTWPDWLQRWLDDLFGPTPESQGKSHQPHDTEPCGVGDYCRNNFFRPGSAPPPPWMPSIRFPQCHIVPVPQIEACCRNATGWHDDEDESICGESVGVAPQDLPRYSQFQFCLTESYQANGF